MSNNELSFWQRLVKKLTRANELGHEEEVMTDHDYDGIRELDNVLPPWWLYGFYITILIGIFYYVQVFTNSEEYSQEKEYAADVKRGKEEVAQYKKDHPELFSDENLAALTDPADIAKGKALFTTNCTACHLADGGGSIGPNLTDEYWINGGGFKNVFHTISKGGRPGKGMIAWEKTFSQKQRQQLASFVLSLQGTTPATPKAPQGEIWKEGNK